MAKAKRTTTPKTAPDTAPAKKAAAARATKRVAKAAKTETGAAAKKAPEAKGSRSAGLRKKYRDQGVCSVTFVLPKEAATDASSVCILGEFNNWSPDAHPLACNEEGDFTITLDLESGRAYRFRYVIDGWQYENDWFADRYEPNPYGGEDSVVDV